jgi:FtsH-binding integral membrane protein
MRSPWERARIAVRPWWAVLTVWGVVNAVNLLQAVGFATRPVAPEVNRVLGLVIVALAVPATAALTAFVRSAAGWRHVAGPLAFDAFVVFQVVVDYWLRIEFREPREPSILVPYLLLFFGSIFLLGAPMFRIDRRLWAVTAVTTIVLLGSMLWAMGQGVG